MHRFALVVLVCAVPLSWLSAQRLSPKEEALLLPNEQEISGVVVDSSDHPIEGASIENTELLRKAITTDASGHFSLSTRAPAFVIRKQGYDGVFMHTANTTFVHVILKASHHVTPACATKASCMTFCFPKVEGVTVSKQVHDIDYSQRFFSVQSKDGVKSISHGSGPLWSLGIPSNENVWLSVDYSEKEWLLAGYSTIDARGRTSEGRYWRYVGRLGESASYRDVDKESADLLDRVLDGMCTAEIKNR